LIFIRIFSFRFTHSIFEKEKAEAAKRKAKEAKENAEGKKTLIEEKKKKQEEAKKKLEEAEKDADDAKNKVSCVHKHEYLFDGWCHVNVCIDACSTIFKVKDKLKEAAKPVEASAECRAAINSNFGVDAARQQLFDLSQSPIPNSPGCVAPRD
jgi:hypothetical protein